MSLSALGSILKDFWESMSVDVWSYSWLNTIGIYTSHVEFGTLGVFMCMYMMVTSVLTKRWTLTSPKLDEPFDAWFHFENF